MSIKSVLDRLRYKHKGSAIRYFLHDPRLVFGIPAKPTKLHISSVIERTMGKNIVPALHYFLPQWFLEHINKEKDWDTLGYRLMLYLLVRKYKPGVVVETGVARGVSSAYILCAMDENNKGHLYSIDLPPAEAATEESGDGRLQLADGQIHRRYKVGHFVPERLKDRWSLVLGDAKKELLPLLEKLECIDMFYHDSLHTYEHMKFEYETVWPYLADGGLLLSDDILWNKAFYEMCKRYGSIQLISSP
jgi:predicted O-methyltransferase YrrM